MNYSSSGCTKQLPHAARALMNIQEPEIDRANGEGFRGLGTSVWRRKWLVLFCILLGGAAGVALSKFQTPIYRASTRIEIFLPNNNFLNTAEVNPALTNLSEDSHLQTQIEVLQSKTLIDRVVAKVGYPDKTVSPGFHGDASPKAARNLRINSVRGTRLLSIAFDSVDPRFAAQFVNQLAQEYMKQVIETRWDATQNVGTWLNGQLASLKLEVEQADSKLQHYARASGLMFLTDKENVAEQKLKHLEQELSRAQADTILKRSRAEQVTNGSTESIGEVLENVSLRSYRSELVKLKQERADMQALLTPAHPNVKRLEAKISELERLLNQEKVNILEQVRNELTSASRREELLRIEYDRQVQLVSGLAGNLVRYNTMKQEADSSRQSYQGLLQRVKEAGVASAIRASNVRIVDLAEPPSNPISPKPYLNVSAGLLMGSLLGVGLALARQNHNHRFVARGDSQRTLPVPHLGAIPSGKAKHLSLPGYSVPNISKGDQATALNIEGKPTNAGFSRSGNKIEFAALLNDRSFFSESIRKVLASILLNEDPAEQARVLVVASPLPGEGKTTVVSNLGLAMARAGRRVLLVDADARKQDLHSLFHAGSGPGLVDVLNAREERDHVLRKAIRATAMPNLFVLSSGAGTGNFTDLLFSGNVKEVLDVLRGEFDTVLIDTPPVLLMADARPLGRVADGVLLVVRSGKTERDNAICAIQTFAEDGTRVLGTILNDWDPGDETGYRPLTKYYKAGKKTDS